MKEASRCPVCTSPHVVDVVRMSNLPVDCNRPTNAEAEALEARRADIDLVACSECGHLYNRAFEPELGSYGDGYENSLSFSGRFRQYAEALVEELSRRHPFEDARVMEIGSGSGEFLQALSRRMGVRGIGFDPSRKSEHIQQPGVDVELVSDYYSSKYGNLGADLVVCRHVLEHVSEPVQLLEVVRGALRNADSGVYFEVPNAGYLLRSGGVWDVIYEHCGYFTASSLRRTFELARFERIEIEERYGGQFLACHAVAGPVAADGRGSGASRNPAATPRTDAEATRDLEQFATAFRDKTMGWQEQLAELSHNGEETVVWGAGSKGVTFLNLVDRERRVTCAVDVNPRKSGRFVVGTGHPIVHPEMLRDRPVKTVVVMNPIYHDEIARQAHELGLRPKLVAAF